MMEPEDQDLHTGKLTQHLNNDASLTPIELVN